MAAAAVATGGVGLLTFGLFAAATDSFGSWRHAGAGVALGLGAGVLAVAAGAAALVAMGGLIALRRYGLEQRGQPYVVRTRRESVGGLLPWSTAVVGRMFATVFGRPSLCLRPGELVEVRTFKDIRRTLDAHGTLDGLPFMPEMMEFCGERFHVMRRVEKLNDYIDMRGFRRMRNVVMLDGLRCSGEFHGHCQSNCHLRWNEAWLRRAEAEATPAPIEPPPVEAEVPPVHKAAGENAPFFCQATELTSNSTQLSHGDPRVYIRELLVGNVRLRPFLVGVSLAIFNWVQGRRGGVGFPALLPTGGKTSLMQTLDLQVGESVRIKAKHDIELTLNDRGRNRGLWFDVDMLRYCGGEYTVQARVERVIKEKTGDLMHLTNPCVTLEGVTATGEYLAFNAEDDQIFWREIWLARAPGRGPGA